MTRGKADNKAQQVWDKYGVVTLHPRLPSKTEQVAAARAWGVAESWLAGADVSALFIDDLRRVKTNNWGPRMIERRALLSRLHHIAPEGGCSIFFYSPLCVGFSAKQAEAEIAEIHAAGWGVYVHTRAALYVAGDDLSELLAAVDSEGNVSRVRASRSKSKS